MLKFLKITGDSMLPTLADGDFVLIRSFYLTLAKGDLIVVNHPHYASIIKRITFIDGNKNILLAGDNKNSVSSERMGMVCSTQVMGKVIFSIKRKIK